MKNKPKLSREERLAQQLRANLIKRKQQSRQKITDMTDIKTDQIVKIADFKNK